MILKLIISNYYERTYIDRVTAGSIFEDIVAFFEVAIIARETPNLTVPMYDSHKSGDR